ncbi:hypothetical protein Q1695_004831 [Nippostrongylus brasiliensis]|nr:hypothetical protein Q1695_004831 [Nippostrongylus brasiliensis]
MADDEDEGSKESQENYGKCLIILLQTTSAVEMADEDEDHLVEGKLWKIGFLMISTTSDIIGVLYSRMADGDGSLSLGSPYTQQYDWKCQKRLPPYPRTADDNG